MATNLMLTGVGDAGEATFSPLDLPGLKAWFDFTDPTKVSTTAPNINSITDKSPSGLVLSQATLSLKPETATINGLTVGSGDGVDDLLTQTGVTPFTGETGFVYAVIRIPSTAPTGNMNFFNASIGTAATPFWAPIRVDLDTNPYFGIFTSQNATAGNRTSVRGSTVILPDTTYIVCSASNGSAYAMRVNGADETLTVLLGSNDGRWVADVSTLTRVSLFDMIVQGGAAAGRGYIGEIIACDGVTLDAVTAAKIENYLAAKFAVTLP